MIYVASCNVYHVKIFPHSPKHRKQKYKSSKVKFLIDDKSVSVKEAPK